MKTKLGKSESHAEESRLRVDVSAAGGISQGELLKLAFEVSRKTEVYQVIKLMNLRQTVRSVKGKAVEIRGIDEVITIFPEKTPLNSCFFYMH